MAYCTQERHVCVLMLFGVWKFVLRTQFISVQGVNVRHNWKPFCALEGKFLLVALVIVRITLNVIVRQMPLNVR